MINVFSWSTDVGALIYAYQYREITTRLPSEYVYGAGEHTHMSFQHDLNYKTWGLWSHDQTQNLFGVPQNLYGVHPYVMVVEDSKGNAFGSLLLNSNAMGMFSPVSFRTNNLKIVKQLLLLKFDLFGHYIIER